MRSLNIVEDRGEWALAFAKQLDKPVVVNNNGAGSIPKSCPSLRELSYVANNGGSVDVTSIDSDIVGSKVEILTLGGFRHLKMN